MIAKIRRLAHSWWQRRLHGFSASDVSSLNQDISKFALPRLKALRQHGATIPIQLTAAEWDSILGEIIWFFEIHAAGEWDFYPEDEQVSLRYDQAGRFLGQYFGSLWL